MKIAICGSMYFAKNFLEAKNFLADLGHEALIPMDTDLCIEKPDLNADYDHCVNTQIDKKCFQNVANSDAILVLNYPKNGVHGYIGGATLMEIGLARHFDKKIFLLHELPSEKDLKYSFEVKITSQVCLDGKIENILPYLS